MSLRKTITPKKCSWKRAKSSSNPSLRCITAALWRLCLDSGGNGAPVSAGAQREDSSGAEEIARQIEERFHMKVEIE